MQSVNTKDRVAHIFEDPERCPEKCLLWFHHLPWNYQMSSGKNLWQKVALHDQKGLEHIQDFSLIM
ncbi:MAG: hypothetical protein HKN76_00155 [Saprospiraceae bacterium]|nr:hypothetical protein [Saprospiraceae bacterium]